MSPLLSSVTVPVEHDGEYCEVHARIAAGEESPTVVLDYGDWELTFPWPVIRAAAQAALRASREATEKCRRGQEQFLVRRTYAGQRVTYLAHDQGGGQFVDRDDPWVTAFSRTAAEKQVAWQKQRLHWEGDRVRYDLVPIATEATYPNQYDRAALEAALSA